MSKGAKKIRKSKYLFEDMQVKAISKGGSCLSQSYESKEWKFLFECTKGHNWKASGRSIILIDTWCPYCSGHFSTISINDLVDCAKQRGGNCLSEKYINSSTKLEWICKDGHKWFTKWDIVRRGSWCPVCAGKNKREHKGKFN